MIFVTLGTQDKEFKRILRVIEKEVKKGKIKDVLVQAGFTKYKTNKFKVFDYVSQDDFDKYMKECDFVITHAGVGSIFTALKYNKKILAMPRLSRYREHNNDHQKDILSSYAGKNVIMASRPDYVYVDEVSLKENAGQTFDFVVDYAEYLGSYKLVYGSFGDEVVVAKVDSRDKVDAQVLKACFKNDKIHFFDVETTKRIR